jgi:hypothetical protein
MAPTFQTVIFNDDDKVCEALEAVRGPMVLFAPLRNGRSRCQRCDDRTGFPGR